MTVQLGYSGAILAIAEETEWGNAVTPTVFIELLSGSINKSVEQLHSKAINGISMDDDEHSIGATKVDAKFEFEFRYEGMEKILKHALGGSSSAEVASFIVADTNHFIDFKEDSGAEITVTLTNGTYAMGATSAVAGSLCKLIKDAMDAAVGTSATYTVAFNVATGIVTISATGGGVSTISLLFKTGTHGSDGTNTSMTALLGYATATDRTAALSYAGTTAVTAVYDHTFTIADALPVGLTCELDEVVNGATMLGGKIASMDMSIEYGDFLKCSIGCVGKDKTYNTKTSPTLSTKPLVKFSQGAATYTSTISIISAKFSINNGLKIDRAFIGSATIDAPTRNTKIEVTGSLMIEFENSAKFDDFVAATSRAIGLTFTGGNIKTGFTYTMTITFPICKVIGSNPTWNGEGPMTLEVPFKAYAASQSGAREISIVMRNAAVSV